MFYVLLIQLLIFYYYEIKRLAVRWVCLVDAGGSIGFHPRPKTDSPLKIYKSSILSSWTEVRYKLMWYCWNYKTKSYLFSAYKFPIRIE